MQETVKKYFLFAVEKGVAKLKEVKTGINSDGRMDRRLKFQVVVQILSAIRLNC